jgi:hypothetical protein
MVESLGNGLAPSRRLFTCDFNGFHSLGGFQSYVSAYVAATRNTVLYVLKRCILNLYLNSVCV